MILDGKIMFFPHFGEEIIQVVAFKIDGFFTFLADQQMLMPLCVGEIGVTAIILMYALSKV